MTGGPEGPSAGCAAAGSCQVCTLEGLGDGECREFSYRDGGETLRGFVVRSGDNLYAYRNACPHLGVGMNWMPNHLLDSEGLHIRCALHGALFEIASGRCVVGPCLGQGLQKLSILVDGDSVFLRGD